MPVQPPGHFWWEVTGRSRPSRWTSRSGGPARLRQLCRVRRWFRALALDPGIKMVVITGARQLLLGRQCIRHNRASTGMEMPELLAFTRMTGDVVKAMRLCPQPIIAAVEGVCAEQERSWRGGDLRYRTRRLARRSCWPRRPGGLDVGAPRSCSASSVRDTPRPR